MADALSMKNFHCYSDILYGSLVVSFACVNSDAEARTMREIEGSNELLGWVRCFIASDIWQATGEE